MTKELQIVVDVNDACGEAPIWDWRIGRMFWNDIPARLIHSFDPESLKVEHLSSAPQSAGLALAKGGGLVLAGMDGFHWAMNGKTVPLLNGERAPFNDILATPKGRLFAGTYFWDDTNMTRTGALYLIDFIAGSMTQVDEGIELSNGLALSPDGRTLYYADSAARRIYQYELDPETEIPRNRRVFTIVGSDEGIPDGLTVDAEGYLWCAQWYGSQIVRYDPDGKINRRIAVPVQQVSSLAFGGTESNVLFITTAGEPWESKLAPAEFRFKPGQIGGPLYAMRTEVQGRTEHQVRLK